MSGAHDKRPRVYPEKQGERKQFENIFKQYHARIRKFFSININAELADDLTQQVFVKAMQNFQSFRNDSSVFTWLFKIAQNALKNEYRKISRSKEDVYDLTIIGSKFISLNTMNDLEIRIDISSAIRKLNPLDQQIITLRFFVGCTLAEISEIVEKRESAVKNRLYRSLGKLRSELKEWGGLDIMSVQNMISIVSKNDSNVKKNENRKVYEDIFNELHANVDRISSKYNHRPSKKIIIEIYPDLPAFHQAAGETDAPNWFMGTIEGDLIKIVSPLNPGPEHTYQSILKSTTHLFAMWLVSDINPHVPKWLRQGIGGYEADQMTSDYIKSTISEAVLLGVIPTFSELNNDTWDFESMKGFQFSYKIIEYIIKEYGLDELNRFIRNPSDFQGIFHCPETELRSRWIQDLKEQLL